MNEITLTTSHGDMFTVSIDNEGCGYLHAIHGVYDKVRVKTWELDNEDGLFEVDPNLESEWDDLLSQYIERVAREWAESEDVGWRLVKLRALRGAIWEMDKRHRAERKEKVKEFRQAFNALLQERMALPHGEPFKMSDTRFNCCHSYEVQRIMVGDEVLIEDID